MKIHSRQKRYWALGTSRRHYDFFHAVASRVRAKTFGSESAAKEWAIAQGMDTYEIVPAKKDRFRIL